MRSKACIISRHPSAPPRTARHPARPRSSAPLFVRKDRGKGLSACKAGPGLLRSGGGCSAEIFRRHERTTLRVILQTLRVILQTLRVILQTLRLILQTLRVTLQTLRVTLQPLRVILQTLRLKRIGSWLQHAGGDPPQSCSRASLGFSFLCFCRFSGASLVFTAAAPPPMPLPQW
ncbi:hypothetical protein FQA47_010873 [Oryzias melastigma]|uniref:Uncharacterized protein n=1 Tax=Oryzias melastigma TaxID=30732 RepID=A0A834CHK8_ORYME|nr:hypothetical protein FQA47_010873 [Oryzias melastigma]